MKLYKLEWSWYEDHQYYLFIHADNKTEKEFKDDVKKLLRKYGKEYLLKSERSWAGANDWIAFVAEKMPELGYEPIEPITSAFWGAFIIKSDDTKWSKIVGKTLFDKAIAHNKQIKNRFK